MTLSSDIHENELITYLNNGGIRFERFEHTAISATKDAKSSPAPRGEKTKNILLKVSKADRYFLVVMKHDAQVDVQALQLLLAIRSLSIASAADAMRVLGVNPESVSLLALKNDTSKRVTLAVDMAIWDAEETQHYPLVNTSTLVLSGKDLRRFLKLVNHVPNVIAIPGA